MRRKPMTTLDGLADNPDTSFHTQILSVDYLFINVLEISAVGKLTPGAIHKRDAARGDCLS
jgi:hypothetical protein